MSLVHFLAKTGNIQRLKALLERDPRKIEWVDDNGWTPLFYAAHYHRRATIRFLLRKGASHEAVDFEQANLIDTAKKTNPHHNRTSRLLKKYMGLDQDRLFLFQNAFEAILKNEILNAKKNNKKILILIGESHGAYKIYQLEKIMLQIAKRQGINLVYSENTSAEMSSFAIDIKAKEMLKMEMIGVDKHPDKKNASLDERNKYIADEINKIGESGVFMTGMSHLYGLLTKGQTQIDLSHFHVVPINVVGILDECACDGSVESIFAFDKNNVIQCGYQHFTDCKSVSRKWNDHQVVAAKQSKRFLSR